MSRVPRIDWPTIAFPLYYTVNTLPLHTFLACPFKEGGERLEQEGGPGAPPHWHSYTDLGHCGSRWAEIWARKRKRGEYGVLYNLFFKLILLRISSRSLYRGNQARPRDNEVRISCGFQRFFSVKTEFKSNHRPNFHKLPKRYRIQMEIENETMRFDETSLFAAVRRFPAWWALSMCISIHTFYTSLYLGHWDLTLTE